MLLGLPVNETLITELPESEARPLRVLIVDDEPDLSESIAWRLESAGYDVGHVANGLDALELIVRERPDVVLLDMVLPGKSGIDVLRELRQASIGVPVILISGRSDETDRIVSLELGADDFVIKPFSPRELVARIGSVLRRARQEPELPELATIRVAEIEIDQAARRVMVRGQDVSLTSKEYRLLIELARRPDRAMSRNELLDAVWGDDALAKPEATLTEHVSRLRRKIEADPSDPRYLLTVWGVGYVLRS